MAPEADMWMITAVIQPFKLDAVVLALQELDTPVGMTVSECRGFGRSVLASQPSIAGESTVDFAPKTKIEIALTGAESAAHVAKVIATAARTGRKGDGKVFVSALADAIRIRTSEVGNSAL